MCTISFDSEELNVLLDAVNNLHSYVEYRLAVMDPDDLGSWNESVCRHQLKVSKDLIEKLTEVLTFNC